MTDFYILRHDSKVLLRHRNNILKPDVRVKVGRRGKKRSPWTEVGLIPGYMLLANYVPITEAISPLLVRYRSSGNPAEIRIGVVKMMVEAAQAWSSQDDEHSQPSFALGDRVELQNSVSFDGQTGVVTEVGMTYVTVELDEANLKIGIRFPPPLLRKI